MGLLTIVRKLKRKEKQIRLLLVGLDNAGKTTVLRSVLGEDIKTVEPTLGFNISSLPYKGFTLNLWDVGGQKSIRAYWRNYFEQTDGLIWVVDSADVLRLDDCKSVLHSLLLEERLAGASLLVLANKQDLAGSIPPEQISKILDLDTIAKGRRHVHLCGCSAVTKDGVAKVIEGIDWIVKDISARIYSLE